MLLRQICEVCGKEEILTSDQAHEQGWDYPPMIGQFKMISPRTCGSCGIDRLSGGQWALSARIRRQAARNARPYLERVREYYGN